MTTTTTTTTIGDTMHTTDHTTILVSKIEKLWRKANDGGATDAERQAFETKALSLMEENRITMAMLELDGEDVLGDHFYDDVKGRYSRVEIDILDAIARAYDCRTWWRNMYGGNKQVFVFGFKSDAERTILLAKMLMVDARTQAAKERGIDSGHTFSIRHSFMSGYASAIGRRLRDAARLANKAMEEEHGPEAVASTDLVLVSRREQMHKQYAARKFRTVGPTKTGSGSGYSRGHEAGQNASLSTQGAVKARKALAS